MRNHHEEPSNNCFVRHNKNKIKTQIIKRTCIPGFLAYTWCDGRDQAGLAQRGSSWKTGWALRRGCSLRAQGGVGVGRARHCLEKPSWGTGALREGCALSTAPGCVGALCAKLSGATPLSEGKVLPVISSPQGSTHPRIKAGLPTLMSLTNVPLALKVLT